MSESNVDRLNRIKELVNTDFIYVFEHPFELGVSNSDVNIDDDIEWLIEQAKRAQKLKAENYQYRIKYENTGAVMGRMSQRMLSEENKKLRKALEFYANKKMYIDIFSSQWMPGNAVIRDEGAIARYALEESE